MFIESLFICYFCHPSTLFSHGACSHDLSRPESDIANRLCATVVRPVSLCCHPEIDCIFKMSLPNAFSIAHSLPNFTVSIYFFHCAFQVFFFCAGQLFFLPFSSCLVFILPLKGVVVVFFEFGPCVNKYCCQNRCNWCSLEIACSLLN